MRMVWLSVTPEGILWSTLKENTVFRFFFLIFSLHILSFSPSVSLSLSFLASPFPSNSIP